MTETEPPLEVWCRLEEQGDRIWRVHVMHPNREILFSYPPDHFYSGLVRPVHAGQILARLSDAGPGAGQFLSLADESGRVIFTESLPARSIAQSRDGAER